MARPWFLYALALMGVGSYIDNARGPLLPRIAEALQLPYSHAAWLFAGGNLSAVAAAFVLLAASKRWTEERLTVAALLFGCVAVAATHWVENFPTFLLFAALCGSAVYLLGTLANLWVLRHAPVEKRSRYFCALHTMYGAASLFAPVAVGRLFLYTPSWRAPFWVYVPLAAVLLFTLRGASRGTPVAYLPDPQAPAEARPHSSVAKRSLWVVTLCLYVVAEVLVASWMVAFVVGRYAIAPVEAGKFLTGFFLVMAITRGICSFVLSERWEKPLLYGSIVGSLAFAVLGQQFGPWFLPLAGVLGPFFPLFVARSSKVFAQEGKSMTQILLFAVQGMLVVAHVCMGGLADRYGVAFAYWSPVPCFLLVLALLPFLDRRVGAGVAWRAGTV